MHRVQTENDRRIWDLSVIAVLAFAVALNGACFDTQTRLCDAVDLRCGPGWACAANQLVCIPIGGCGDGVASPGEVCDDGNILNGDGCNSNCTSMEICGDGVLNEYRGEECDSGSDDTSLCNRDCTLSICGDRYANSAAGEQCDDGGVD